MKSTRRSCEESNVYCIQRLLVDHYAAGLYWMKSGGVDETYPLNHYFAGDGSDSVLGVWNIYIGQM
jgi:hypothetical protein